MTGPDEFLNDNEIAPVSAPNDTQGRPVVPAAAPNPAPAARVVESFPDSDPTDTDAVVRVRAAVSTNETLDEIALMLGVPYNRLTRWRRLWWDLLGDPKGGFATQSTTTSNRTAFTMDMPGEVRDQLNLYLSSCKRGDVASANVDDYGSLAHLVRALRYNAKPYTRLISTSREYLEATAANMTGSTISRKHFPLVPWLDYLGSRISPSEFWMAISVLGVAFIQFLGRSLAVVSAYDDVIPDMVKSGFRKLAGGYMAYTDIDDAVSALETRLADGSYVEQDSNYEGTPGTDNFAWTVGTAGTLWLGDKIGQLFGDDQEDQREQVVADFKTAAQLLLGHINALAEQANYSTVFNFFGVKFGAAGGAALTSGGKEPAAYVPAIIAAGATVATAAIIARSGIKPGISVPIKMPEVPESLAGIGGGNE